jgi:hypothetical protein
MPAPPIAPIFDVPGNCRTCLIAALPLDVINQLGLQARKEALRHRVIPTVALAAHAAHDAVLFQQPSVVAITGDFLDEFAAAFRAAADAHSHEASALLIVANAIAGLIDANRPVTPVLHALRTVAVQLVG